MIEPTQEQIKAIGRHDYDDEFRAKMSESGKQRTGDKAGNWHGGKSKINRYGYVLEFDETMPPTRGGRYSPRYRRAMEETLGRKLERHETVHHINGIKDDDNPDNLYLCTLSSHRTMHNEMSQLVMELYREGWVKFKDGKYYLSEQRTQQLLRDRGS